MYRFENNVAYYQKSERSDRCVVSPAEITSFNSIHCDPKIAAGQIRAARSLVKWRQIDLAKAADYSLSSISRVESGCLVFEGIYLAIARAFITKGLVFVEDGVDMSRAQQTFHFEAAND